MTVSKGVKPLVIVGAIFVFILAAMAATPLLFKDKITEITKNELNKKLNAKVDFNKINISLFRNFPNASISLKDLKIVGVGDFSIDTLVNSKDINLVINLKSLFSDTGYEVKNIQINDTKVYAHILKDGRANWNIMKEDTTAQADTTSSSFTLKLQKLGIHNADITYVNDSSDMSLEIKNLNHTLSGDLTADSTTLATKTTIDSLSFWMGKIKYANQLNVAFDADIKANFKDSKYTLANNSAKINAIPFSINGWVQMLDNGYDMDLKLNTDKVDFKSILSLIPALYAESFKDIKTDGKVEMSGFAKGKMIDEIYPAFAVKMNVSDAWFQYPSLPKSVKAINVIANITHPGGNLDATVVDVPKFSFNMGGNPFSGSLHVVTPMSDPDFSMKAVGKLDLGMIKDVYPLEKGTELNGVLDMNVNAAGKMSYVDNNQYDKFTFSGTVNVKNMVAKTESLTQKVSISNANLLFNNRYLNLTNLAMKIGENDIKANGKVENYMAYALKDKTLTGDFSFASNYMNLNDFMSSDKSSESDTSSLEVIILPKNLNLGLTGNINKLIYDKMNFTNAKASMKLADGNLVINNMSTDGFGGTMGLSGTYSTSNPSKPRVDMKMNLTDITFTEIFKQVKTIQKLAPIFEHATGKFNTALTLNSLLKKDMMPDLTSLTSLGKLDTKSVGLTGVEAFTQLASSLGYTQLAKSTLKDIVAQFSVDNGKITTKPFNVKIGDTKLNIGGITGLDQTIDYAGKITLPSKLNAGKLQSVSFTIGGTFSKPKIKLDVASTVSDALGISKDSLSNKVAETKQKAIETVNAKKDEAIKTAQQQADKLMANAKAAGDKLIEEAQTKGNELVSKTSNPLAKLAAQKASDELVKQAKNQANKLTSEAKNQGDKLIQQASEKATLK